MTDSSAESAELLAKVRPQNLLLLLEIIQDAVLPQREHVSARFSERASHFPETLQFAEALGWIRLSGQTLQLSGDAPARILDSPIEFRSTALAEGLVELSGPLQFTLARYLSRFELRVEGLSYKPAGELRLKEAPPRDFLMALGAVVHQVEGDLYVLTQSFAFLRLWATNVLGPVNQAQIDQAVLARTQLGLEAELAVLGWEKRRLGGAAAERVRHISAENPAACYDIQSITVERTRECPRFIEVKAVPQSTHEFHWSAAEIEAAQILGERYFLYLAPVAGASHFDLDNLQIIQNPFENIYQNHAVWSREAAIITCRRKNASAT